MRKRTIRFCLDQDESPVPADLHEVVLAAVVPHPYLMDDRLKVSIASCQQRCLTNQQVAHALVLDDALLRVKDTMMAFILTCPQVMHHG